MRSTKLITTLALAFSAVAATTAVAQQPARPDSPARAEQQGENRGPGQRGRGPEGFLLKGITLSAAQQAQLDSLHAQMRAQFEAGRGQREQGGQQMSDADRQARRAQMEQRRDAMNARLRAILTPDQQKQFDKNVADMKARMQERGQGRGWRGGN